MCRPIFTPEDCEHFAQCSFDRRHGKLDREKATKQFQGPSDANKTSPPAYCDFILDGSVRVRNRSSTNQRIHHSRCKYFPCKRPDRTRRISETIRRRVGSRTVNWSRRAKCNPRDTPIVHDARRELSQGSVRELQVVLLQILTR